MNPSRLDAVLTALPPPCRERLVIMGWPDGTIVARDPDQALRRAIGAAQRVSLVDLELEPERWHGAYVTTHGTVGWSDDTTCLGRLWLDPSLSRIATGPKAQPPPLFQARVTGIMLADAQVRAEHRLKHHSPGGYGNFGLFIAELVATSIQVEVAPPSSRSNRGRHIPK